MTDPLVRAIFEGQGPGERLGAQQAETMGPGTPRSGRRSLLLGIALAGLLLAAGDAAGAPSDPFPVGKRLQPRVEFWKRIYSEVTSDQVLLHDAEDLRVVYQRVGLEGRNEWRDIEKFIEPIRQRYADVLRSLAAGEPPLAASEAAEVLARFGPGAAPERLRRAADNVRFQRGQADSFLEGLVRRGAYESHLRRIFRAAGLPHGLTYLPHVESSFRPHAYSRSGAAGIWQFTRSTGRHYLHISALADERWDPIDSTRAAARLLGHNYRQLGSWPLAITAYNHGLQGMKRAVARLGTRDIEEIIERYDGRIFGFASKNFYAEFLAAREVASNPERYFGRTPRWTELRFQELRLDRTAVVPELARALRLSVCDLSHYNPALRAPALEGEKPLPVGYRLKLPEGAAPPGSSIAAILDAQHPAAMRAKPPGARPGTRPGAAPPAAWIASLSGPPPAGPGGAGASPFLDAALLWTTPGGVGARPRPTAPAPLPPPAPRLAAAPPAPQGPRTAQAATPSPWVGSALPRTLRLHPDWTPWMIFDPAGVPAGLGLSAARITDGRIQVEPEENLALLAFWLSVPASQLRQMNDLRPGQALRLGQWLRADFSRVSEEKFLELRVRYQRELAAEFLRRHRVTSTRTHEVRRGETLWSIARRHGRLPLWLLRWYNDGPGWLEPAPGTSIVVPVVESLSS